MSSRWGPKRSRSHSPVPPASSSRTSSRASSPFAADEPDFELIDATIWKEEEDEDNNNSHSQSGANGGGSQAYQTRELAVKPKPDRSDDPCTCRRSQDVSSVTCNDLSCVLFACQEECRSNCEAGEQCGNKRIQKRQWKNIEVFSAGKKGKGLRILEDVKKGDFIAEYVGRAIQKEYLPTLFRRYARERKLYIMALTSDIYLDARRQGGIARYINHSCEPNCMVERWKVRGYLRAAIMAKQDIPAGTELSFDYQWERKRGRAPTKCHCDAPTCRGTLEVPRSMEEKAMERKLSTHWTKPLISRAGKEIVNRCIRLFNKETHEYFAADVTNYDESTGKHQVIYQHDLEEAWEDLKEENWMILDEDAEQFIIRKKRTESASDALSRSLLQGPNLLLQGQATKNFLFVQTPIKDAMYSKHLIERCQHTCRVTITAERQGRPPLDPNPDNSEEVEKYKALDRSADGTVWKLSILGSDITKAYNILEKNVGYLEKNSTTPVEAPTVLNAPNVSRETGGEPVVEIVIPRFIVEAVKRRLPSLRDKCRSVNITFAPSESKSKQFAKLIIEGSLQSDVESAKDPVWKQLNIICSEQNAPTTAYGVYRDLGMLGGQFSNTELQLLLECVKTEASKTVKHQDAKEDLMRLSPFFASFQNTQRCSIWIQSDADKGRINGSNLLVDVASPNSPRKVFFGCDPKLVPTLWALVSNRAQEIARGVKFLYLGTDRMYLAAMTQNGSQFFEYVKAVTGASVIVDLVTGDHLRIDGRTGTAGNPSSVSTGVPEHFSESDRAALATEMVRLQIELYRDHCIRQQSWIFGRDWTLARRNVVPVDQQGLNVQSGQSRATAPRTQFDTKALSNACLEIAEIVAALGHIGGVAAHSAVILHRFATTMHQNTAAETSLKMREISLACVFIANKAQKVTKWKKLDAVLEAAYKIFYPGVSFDSSKEEVLVWEERVIAAEMEVLEMLEYDVFWRGVDWIVDAASGVGGIDRNVAKEALFFSMSGPVLAAGSDLWLTYGLEYVFAASAGFMEADVEKLIPVLCLIPIKIAQAADLIATSVKTTGLGKKLSSHHLFKDGKDTLLNRLPRIKGVCDQQMKQYKQGYDLSKLAEGEQRYRIVGERDKARKIYRSIPGDIVKQSIVPTLATTSAQSKCSIFIERQDNFYQSVILEGSWRAISIASFLLDRSLQGKLESYSGGPAPPPPLPSTVQAKSRPGIMEMVSVESADGWSGTIQSTETDQEQTSWKKKTGGKSCIPAKVKEQNTRRHGLRWWIPPQYGPSLTGSICDMCLNNDVAKSTLGALAELTVASQGESDNFSMLESSLPVKDTRKSESRRYIAVSLQRWPPEKVAKREEDKVSRGKDLEKKKKKSTKRPAMKTGYSPAALQEMQLLTRLHRMVQSPRGHPNFILPVAIALPSSDNATGASGTGSSNGTKGVDMAQLDEDIFSLTRSSLENEIAAEKDRKRKDLVTGPHLVFQPMPFILQKFVSRKSKSDFKLSLPIIAAWVHDLLSAMMHCHSNSIVLRNLQSDQIVIDQSGVVKLGSLYRATNLSKEDRGVNILNAARERSKQKSRPGEEEDVTKDPYVAPEILLGSPKFTKATDMWVLGCLLAHLILQKPLYSGKDRQSLLLALYKIVGVPSSENFPSATKFPYFKSAPKKYRAGGVGKAISFLMKDDNQEFAGVVDLISRMLHLDPQKRISAKQALEHDFMVDYIERSSTDVFRQKFVTDWTALKATLVQSTKTEEEETTQKERGIKRKAAMLLATKSSTNGSLDDDLYDMDDLLGGSSSGASKQPRVQ